MGGEDLVELDFAGIDAVVVAALDDRIEFGFDTRECFKGGIGFGCAEGEVVGDRPSTVRRSLMLLSVVMMLERLWRWVRYCFPS